MMIADTLKSAVEKAAIQMFNVPRSFADYTQWHQVRELVSSGLWLSTETVNSLWADIRDYQREAPRA